MKTPVGYTRSTFHWRNEMHRDLTADDAQQMLGMRLTVSLGSVVMSTGTVTAAKVVDGGERMQMTVETGGRWCPACGQVYPAETAGRHLAALTDVQARTPGRYVHPPAYDDLPSWVRVCRDWGACRARQDAT